MQQVDRGADDAGWHLDLAAGDPGSAAGTAVSLGARRVRAGADLVTLTTSAGQPFCLVNGHERQRHAAARRHEALGAITEQVAEHWITLRDSAGLRYCITDRKPAR